MSNSSSTLIYLDTNVYSRPFDDQTQQKIQGEANAFLEIVREIKTGTLSLIGSDILEFEVYNIFDREKCSRILGYLCLCTEQISITEEVLNLSINIENECKIRARDALHIASAILIGARYFLSCDRKVTQMKKARCYRRLAKVHRREYFSVMNPILFAEEMRKGELE